LMPSTLGELNRKAHRSGPPCGVVGTAKTTGSDHFPRSGIVLLRARHHLIVLQTRASRIPFTRTLNALGILGMSSSAIIQTRLAVPLVLIATVLASYALWVDHSPHKRRQRLRQKVRSPNSLARFSMTPFFINSFLLASLPGESLEAVTKKMNRFGRHLTKYYAMKDICSGLTISIKSSGPLT
jgi:hypothetical protein